MGLYKWVVDVNSNRVMTLDEESLSTMVIPTLFSGLSKITVGTEEPSNPSVGDLWIDTNP